MDSGLGKAAVSGCSQYSGGLVKRQTAEDNYQSLTDPVWGQNDVFLTSSWMFLMWLLYKPLFEEQSPKSLLILCFRGDAANY